MVFYLPLAGQNDFYFTLAEKNDMKAHDLSFIPLNIPNHQVLVFVSYVQILSIEHSDAREDINSYNNVFISKCMYFRISKKWKNIGNFYHSVLTVLTVL